MDLKLTDQIVVVVGGAKGIGYAIAKEFAQEGASVALADLDPAVAESATAIAEDYGGSALSKVADVTDYGAMAAIAQEIEAELGPVAHLVYAAGIGSGKTGFPFWNIEPHEWARVLEVCLVGAVNTVHAFKDPMLARQDGTILFLTSVAGQIGSQTDPPYSAAKAGMINFMQCAAKDMAPYNIRVNSINPGMVDTELSRRIHAGSNLNLPTDEQTTYDEWAAAKQEKVIPLNRWQQPEDIGAMAVFIASARGNNITGQAINVDGGFVMHS
ncbi:MAG: SDR family oxidoreductase [Chloroflexota bacterium]